MSAILKKSSSNLLNTKNFEQLPDLAINMNIKKEPQFAIYRAIRDPNSKNVLGAIAVFLMSGITIACKNFVEGAKEIWLKYFNDVLLSKGIITENEHRKMRVLITTKCNK